MGQFLNVAKSQRVFSKFSNLQKWYFVYKIVLTYCDKGNRGIKFFDIPKGQIISKQNCGVLNFQKSNKIIVRISALATKMDHIRNMKARNHAN